MITNWDALSVVCSHDIVLNNTYNYTDIWNILSTYTYASELVV